PGPRGPARAGQSPAVQDHGARRPAARRGAARPPGIARRGRSVSRGGWEAGASERLEARCKVNLGLAVLARRGDGYHQIETVMARLALADELEITLSQPPQGADAVELEVVGDRDGREAGQQRAAPAAATPPGADNLA